MTQITERSSPSCRPSSAGISAQIDRRGRAWVTLVVVGSSLANDYESAASTATPTRPSRSSGPSTTRSEQSAVRYRGRADRDAWFTLGLALLLRRYEGEPPWCSVFLAAPVRQRRLGQIAAGTPRRISPTTSTSGRALRLRPRQPLFRERLGRRRAVGHLHRPHRVGTRVLRTGWLGGLCRGRWSALARAVWTEGYVLVRSPRSGSGWLVLSVALLVGRPPSPEPRAVGGSQQRPALTDRGRDRTEPLTKVGGCRGRRGSALSRAWAK